MTIRPEQLPSISEPNIKRREDDLSRPEVARILSFVKGTYDFPRYLPPDADGRLNLTTALAAMHAIDAKGQKEGWDEKDLSAALSVTRVALTTAGFAHAKEGVYALLTGTTGDLQDIVGKILPPDAPKGIKWMAKTMIRANAVDNMRVVAGLLIDEKKLESRLLRLTKLQQDILLDPGKTRALLGVLNGEYLGSNSLAGSGLPQEAIAHLVRISPFSLEDMKAVSGLFDAVEWRRNSAIQRETHRLLIETELKRLDAAGINIAKIVSLGAESAVKNTLLIIGGTVSAAIGGTILGGDKGVEIVGGAIETVKKHNEERKAAKVHTPRMYEATVG